MKKEVGNEKPVIMEKGEHPAGAKEPVREPTPEATGPRTSLAATKQAPTHGQSGEGTQPPVRKQPAGARERLRHAQARHAELASREDEIRRSADRDIAALRERVRMAQAQADASIADARQQERELQEELASTIAIDFYAAMDPLVAAWCEEPKRAAARAIADAFVTFDNRCFHELGFPLWDLAIAYSFAEYILKSKPCAVNAFGQTNLGLQSIIELTGVVRKAIASGITSTETFLEELEHLVEVSAGMPACALGPDPYMVERFRAARTCATHGLAVTRLGSVDAAEHARRQKAAQQQFAEARLRDEEEQKRKLGSGGAPFASAPVYVDSSGKYFTGNDPSMFQNVVRAARELLP